MIFLKRTILDSNSVICFVYFSWTFCSIVLSVLSSNDSFSAKRADSSAKSGQALDGLLLNKSFTYKTAINKVKVNTGCSSNCLLES